MIARQRNDPVMALAEKIAAQHGAPSLPKLRRRGFAIDTPSKELAVGAVLQRCGVG